MRRNTTTIVLVAALATLLMAESATWAQAYGRVALWVRDAQGNALADVKVTAICEELPKFLTETTTNKKGLAKLAFVDATKVYTVTIESPGYVPQTIPVKAELRTTTDRDVVLQKKGHEVAADGTAAPRRYTPAETVFNEGVKLVGDKKLEEAKLKFQEALTLDAELFPAYAALAGVALELKNFDEAITQAKAFLARDPENAGGYYTLYEAYRQKGDEANAAQALAKFSSLDDGGDSAILLYNEGVEALSNGQRPLARQRFEAALAADPELGAARVGLAQVHLDTGEYTEAIAEAERFLATEPSHYLAQRIRYEAYTALDDAANADDAFAQLVAHHGADTAKVHYNKGVELFNANEYDGAIQEFERALAANPNLARAHYYLGLSCINKNRTGEAKEHLTQFLALTPEDPDAAAASDMLQYLKK